MVAWWTMSANRYDKSDNDFTARRATKRRHRRKRVTWEDGEIDACPYTRRELRAMLTRSVAVAASPIRGMAAHPQLSEMFLFESLEITQLIRISRIGPNDSYRSIEITMLEIDNIASMESLYRVIADRLVTLYDMANPGDMDDAEAGL